MGSDADAATLESKNALLPRRADMIRKKLKARLPTPESIRDSRWLRWCGRIVTV